MINNMPETQEELDEMALNRNEATHVYGLKNGLIITFNDGKGKRIGRWDPPLEKAISGGSES